MNLYDINREVEQLKSDLKTAKSELKAATTEQSQMKIIINNMHMELHQLKQHVRNVDTMAKSTKDSTTANIRNLKSEVSSLRSVFNAIKVRLRM